VNARVSEPSSSFTLAPERGAPFAGILVSGLGLALLISLQLPVGWPFSVVLISYMLLTIWWNRRLWEHRWKHVPNRGVGFERTAFWATALLVLGSSLSVVLGNNVVPWVLFALQAAVTVVSIPVTLRRYPGLA
jgi:hypothetical protein